jgi:hypothetical protein
VSWTCDKCGEFDGEPARHFDGCNYGTWARRDVPDSGALYGAWECVSRPVYMTDAITGWQRDDEVRGVAKVDDKPAMTDQPRKQCHRSVSPGDARCWFCTTPDPAPIQTTDDPDWSSSLMRVAVPGPSGGSVGYMSFGSTHVPYPIAPPTSQPYSLTITDKDEACCIAKGCLDYAEEYIDGEQYEKAIAFLDRCREIVLGLK